MIILLSIIIPILALLVAGYGVYLQYKQDKCIKMRCLVGWPLEIGLELCKKFDLFTLLYNNRPIDEGKIQVAEFQLVNESNKSVEILGNNTITITLPETCHILDVKRKKEDDIFSVTHAYNIITITLPNSVMKKDKFEFYALFKNTVEIRPIPDVSSRITNIDINKTAQEEGNPNLSNTKNKLPLNFNIYYYSIIVLLVLFCIIFSILKLLF